jgi:hypothetical protein
MFPLSLRSIDDINFCSWLGSARNRGNKVCFEREAEINIYLLTMKNGYESRGDSDINIFG